MLAVELLDGALGSEEVDSANGTYREERYHFVHIIESDSTLLFPLPISQFPLTPFHPPCISSPCP